MTVNNRNGKKANGDFEAKMGNRPYFYPVRDADNPSKVSLVPIGEELYREVSPAIWQLQKRMQRLGRCLCPKSKLWACDTDCPICQYNAEGNQVSLDALLDEDGDEATTFADTLADDCPSVESVALDRVMLDLLYQALDELDPEGRRICEVLMNHSEREAAAELNMTRSTFKRQWERAKACLRDKLRDFMA